MLIFVHMTDYVNNIKLVNVGILVILKIIDIPKAYRHDKLSLKIHLSEFVCRHQMLQKSEAILGEL